MAKRKKKKDEGELLDKHKRVAEEYLRNGYKKAKAYMAVYKGSSYSAAAVSFNDLLKNPKFSEYISECKKNTAELAGISRLKLATELLDIASTNVVDLHNGWLELKDIDELTDTQKKAISEIKSGYDKAGNPYTHIKLHDKVRIYADIRKMFGFDEAEKLEVNNTNTADISKLSNDELKAYLSLTRKMQGDAE